MPPSCSGSSTFESSYDQSNLKLEKYNISIAVKLPKDENSNEWIATNLYDFYKQISMLYRTLKDFCTADRCRKMTAGNRFEYLWYKDNQSVDYSAPEYIERSLRWVKQQLDDESLFITANDKDFPPEFIDVCKVVSKRLLRVFSHICHEHINDVKNLKHEPHMNTSLKHFIYFVREFGLIQNKSDLEPLKDYLINKKIIHENEYSSFILQMT